MAHIPELDRPLSVDKVWRPQDLEDHGRWIKVLNADELSEIDRAIARAKSDSLTIEELSKENFPLPGLQATLDLTLDKLENDLGVFVLRGLDTSRYAKTDLRLLYWGIGLHLGTPVSQSSKGDVLGDVKNFGSIVSSATGRGYMSREKLAFHTDTADVVGLFVLQTPRSGGLSMFCSSVAIRDEIAATRPDLYQVLLEPFYFSWKGQEEPGALPYYTQPIYSYQDGRFSSRYLSTHIAAAQDFPEVPRLTDAQREALSLIDTLANDPRFHFAMMFEPGDMQFLNNHTTYHARTEFDDYPEEERRRHLLRMWLAVPNSRPLNPGMHAIYRDQTAGAVRGGFPSRSSGHVYETRVSEF
jgi:hypothetical protein